MIASLSEFPLPETAQRNKTWFSPQKFPRRKFYGYEPTVSSPRFHTLSTGLHGMPCRRVPWSRTKGGKAKIPDKVRLLPSP